MLKKLIESFTTVSGSRRGDCRIEAGRIARRCAIASDISNVEAFHEIGKRAALTREAVQDEARCSDADLKTMKGMLIQMGQELAQLEIVHGLREKISEIYRGGGLIAKENIPNEKTIALLIWARFLLSVESFPDEKFSQLSDALIRVNSSLSAFRREVFSLYAFAFEFAIGSSAGRARADLGHIRSGFMSEGSAFFQNLRNTGTGQRTLV